MTAVNVSLLSDLIGSVLLIIVAWLILYHGARYVIYRAAVAVFGEAENADKTEGEA
jgi:hypothetical protein